MKKALALDVGGTKIYNAIVNENGEIISEIEKHATPKTFDENWERYKKTNLDKFESDKVLTIENDLKKYREGSQSYS